MDPLTVEKVHITSGNGADILSEVMPRSSIPREYGGTCTSCPGRYCLDHTRGGPFLSTKEKPITRIEVAKSNAHNVKFDLQDAPCTLNFKYMVASDDIKMQVYHNGKKIYGVGKKKKNEGAITLHENGKYKIRYDNTYSYFSSKTVGFHHQLTK